MFEVCKTISGYHYSTLFVGIASAWGILIRENEKKHVASITC